MTFRSAVSSFIPGQFKRWVRRELRVPDHGWMLSRLKGAGFSPSHVIDVGAYRGEWTTSCLEVFHGARVLMIEPQRERAEHLSALCRRTPGCTLVTALLGPEAGHASFLSDESNSRIVPVDAGAAYTAGTVPMQLRTLDDVAQGTEFSNAQFIKLDVQGSELDVLRGGGPLVGSAEVVLLELSVIPIGNVPIALEVLNFMDARGYRLYDLCEFRYRPRDNALWQIDALFARHGSPLIASESWH